MTQLSYLSDNQLKFPLQSLEGEVVDPTKEWVKIHLQSGGKLFQAVNDPMGSETKNCHVEDGVLVVDIPSRKLGIGVVSYMIEIREDSLYFNDGFKNTYTLGYTNTEIELV